MQHLFVVMMMTVALASSAQANKNADLFEDQKVRVKIMHLKFPISIKGQDLIVRDFKEDGIKKAALFPKSESVTITHANVKGEDIWLLRKDQRTVRSSIPFLHVQSPSGQIEVDGVKTSSPILLSRKKNRVDIIASMDLDDYLRGVIAGEMPSNWPIEVLKAQVVAARSYTLFQMAARKNQPFQLEASVNDQVYLDHKKTDRGLDRIQRAIDQTRGVILLQKGDVVKAYYHSDCGGQTEEASEVWGQKLSRVSALGTTRDQRCPYNPRSRWKVELTVGELKQLIEKKMGQGLKFQNFHVVQYTASKRARLVGYSDGSKNVFLTGDDLRAIIGYDRLRSTMFTITDKKDLITFTGQGYGHGSGLCQWGARFLAENGASVEEILKHYYPHANLSVVHVAHR